jgi:4-hydroxy-tetrahydrodipicolinate reductase
MKIALIGYGKMGRAIEPLALAAGHELVARVGKGQWNDPAQAWRTADVAIEFTHPEFGAEHVMRLLDAGIPVVCGTTGWYHQLPEVEAHCRAMGGKMVVASNFSIGVNLFFAVAEFAAQKMAAWPQYVASIHEIHHTAKVDAPSGTAKTLLQRVENQGYSNLPVTWQRQDPAPGTHILTFSSPVDRIALEHEAVSRDGFAGGALFCAEQIVRAEPGVYRVEQLLFGH